MNVSILASGSKGNSTIIKTKTKNIMIDAGLTFKSLASKASETNFDIMCVTDLLITHSHSDHTKGLLTFINKVRPNLYMSEETYKELNLDVPYNKIDGPFKIGDTLITPITLSHDVKCLGYILEDEKSSLVYITDTGYINERYLDILKNKNVYIFESNHDIEMNLKSKKPEKYRRRVISDFGHLSNKQAAYYLSKIVGDNTSLIFLAHLSEDDNTPSLAIGEVSSSLSKINEKIKIEVAYQNEVIKFQEV